MNGQLNGFHEAFIEEGTFLFTSESVGEGHPGEVTDPGAKRGAGRRQSWACPGPAGGGTHFGYPVLLAMGRAAAARLPRGAAGAQRVAAVPLPLPLLSSPPIRPRAPACGRFQKTRRAGAAASRTLPGEGTISSSPPWRPKNLEWATRFERSRPAFGSARPALQPQPRVCSMWHLGGGSRPAAGALGFTKWGARTSRRLLSHEFLGLSHYYSLRDVDMPLDGILPRLRSDNLQLNIARVGEDMPYLGPWVKRMGSMN